MINFRLANIKRKDTKIYKIRGERDDIATELSENKEGYNEILCKIVCQWITKFRQNMQIPNIIQTIETDSRKNIKFE